MGRSFLERYHQGTSAVHHLDPRLKLLATLAFVLASTSVPPRGWPALLILSALALGVVLLARVPLFEALKRSAIALPFAGMAALSVPFTRAGHVLWAWHPLGLSLAVTDEGLHLFAVLIVKAWQSVLVSGLLVATTTLPDLLHAMRTLGVPTVLTAIISFTVRYLYVLVDEAMRLQTARAARTTGPGGSLVWRTQVLGGMIGSLFIRSYERSERIYAAMLSRGYAGEIRSLTRFAWRARDSWAAVAWGAALVATVVLGHVLY